MKAAIGVVLVLAAALTLAASAHAKEITHAAIWGASGSTTMDDPAQLSLLPLSVPYVTDPPAGAPFYVIDVAADAGPNEHHVVVLYVPSARRAAGIGENGGLEWYPVGRRSARMLDAALADAEPYRGGAWPIGLKSIHRVISLTDATVAGGGGGAPVWPWVAGGIAAAVALAAVVLRRRIRPALRANRVETS
jgi:hypothetical protein